MERTESQENYLETILILSKQKPVVRSVDIANELDYKKSSVSIAVKNLKVLELIDVSPEGYITLTPDGLKIAKSIYERHTILTKCLTSLGVPAAIAEEDACRIEHVIHEKTFKAIKKHVKNNQ